MGSLPKKNMGTPDANSKSGKPYLRSPAFPTRALIVPPVGTRGTAHGGCSNLPGSRALFSGVA